MSDSNTPNQALRRAIETLMAGEVDVAEAWQQFSRRLDSESHPRPAQKRFQKRTTVRLQVITVAVLVLAIFGLFSLSTGLWHFSKASTPTAISASTHTKGDSQGRARPHVGEPPNEHAGSSPAGLPNSALGHASDSGNGRSSGSSSRGSSTPSPTLPTGTTITTATTIPATTSTTTLPTTTTTTPPQNGPVINTVAFSGSSDDYTVTIAGSDFGGSPASLPYTGDLSDFRIGDAAQLGHGEWGYDGDANGLTYQMWNDSEIQVSGLGAADGDALSLALWNPTSGLGATWGGNAGASTLGPSISGVSFSGSGGDLSVTISGADFGASPVVTPFTGDVNNLWIADFAGHCGASSSLFAAGNAGWGVVSANSVTVNISSWSDSSITISGFAGAYGTGCAVVHAGDPVAIELWNSTDSSDTGPQTAWGGFVS